MGKTNKIDLLFMVDNSRSMGDKQEILAQAIPHLLSRVVNPLCIDLNNIPAAMQPADPLSACPSGTFREFIPVTDMHIGVITSSLGDHGNQSACPDVTKGTCPMKTNYSNNDFGHLITRTDPCTNAVEPTYNSLGFLAWDPAAKDNPPGEANANSLAMHVKDLVIGSGQIGCGFESQLESWYRFLVDPNPYKSIAVQNGKAVKSGVDDVLLAQRKAFLRPDSLLVIVMLTDENDCSMVEGNEYWIAAHSGGNIPTAGGYLWPPRSECASDPNDKCCGSCVQEAALEQSGCPADPACEIASMNPTTYVHGLDSVSDNFNLRCYQQKKRFGFDFLYPTSRYADALTSLTLKDQGNAQNPIFSDLDPSDGDSTVRDPSLVLLAGIVGVPWQDIARDPKDLKKGFKSAPERIDAGTWPLILGDIYNYAPPSDPFMNESIDPRSGTNPVTGAAIEMPGSQSLNAINGTEYLNGPRGDLQYACTFPIQPRDCTMNEDCDCQTPGNPTKNPLCDSQNPLMQVRAKAYPGLRQLDVLKQMGDRGVVASICPAQTTDPTASDFAFDPAVSSLIEAMRSRLKP
jgi:hypothetical protein